MTDEYKTTVLVADDNPNNLQVIESMLSEAGFSVCVAMNGKIAVKIAKEMIPDVILLDIHMPGMDGYDACKALKSDEHTSEIPVLFVTALNEEFNKLRGFELGAVDYITKPLSMDELLARVSTHAKIYRQTKRLTNMADELALFNNEMLNREMRIIELKTEVNKLSKELCRPLPHIIPE